jgi:hypothetical protein
MPGLEPVSIGSGGQERRGVLHRAPIGALPSQPDVLDNVLGLDHRSQHAVRNTE